MIVLLLLSLFTFVELNCENLFDFQHDSLRNDYEFLPEGSYHWTEHRFWEKLERIGQEIVACGKQANDIYKLPDFVALCEVENDTALTFLTRRSVLRNAEYDYVMTNSEDPRGVDVAFLYSPYKLKLLNYRGIPVEFKDKTLNTRDILYICGKIVNGDTLHFMVVHAPSRAHDESYRLAVSKQIVATIDSVKNITSSEPFFIIAGDFNAYPQNKTMKYLQHHDLLDISANATGKNKIAKGTYRYQGLWGSLDHILVSQNLSSHFTDCYILDDSFLLEEDKKYGGWKPYRTYLGPRYLGGFSDHLPLVTHFEL